MIASGGFNWRNNIAQCVATDQSEWSIPEHCVIK